MRQTIEYKMLLTWINDISTVPRRGKRWPIIDIDDSLMNDYRVLFSVMKDWGYDAIIIWGLFVNHAWETDIPASVTSGRRLQIIRIIEDAHRQGIKVMSGLGVYSWGFEHIIRKYPETAKKAGRIHWGKYVPDNDVAMCYSVEASREWQRKVIDYMCEYDLDGFQLQSADQGRCACKDCMRYSDMEYHAEVNNEFAAYIRTRKPDSLIAVSGWGMSFEDEANIPSFHKMSRHLTYIADVRDRSNFHPGSLRKRIVSSLDCAFGTLGGMVVTPPQRWERNRWFLTHAAYSSQNTKNLLADGGSAVEYFAGPLVNPGHEIMIKYMGCLLNHPFMEPADAMRTVVADVFRPRDDDAREAIVGLLLQVESDYFNKIEPVYGEFDFEPLMGLEAGPAVYLDRIANEQLAGYDRDCRNVREGFVRLAGRVENRSAIVAVIECMDNMSKDIGNKIRENRQLT